jgi:hypothetical protein
MLRDFTMLASHASRADGARRAAADLAAVGDALGAAGLGLGGRERRHFWCVVEGMLHLGNLHFDDDEGAAGGGGDSDAVGGGGAAGGGGGGGAVVAFERTHGGGARSAEKDSSSAAAAEAAEAAATALATASAQEREMGAACRLLGLPSLASLLWDEPMPVPRRGGDGAADGGGVVAVRRSGSAARTARDGLMCELHGALIELVRSRLVRRMNDALAAGPLGGGFTGGGADGGGMPSLGVGLRDL